MIFLDFFILFIVIVIIFLYLKSYYSEVAYVKSKIDDRTYLVRKLKDKQQAADLLATVNKNMLKLINHLVAEYPDKPEIKRLFANYNPNNVSEGGPENGYTSYSINKGERIILCIRQKNKEHSFVDLNTIIFVSIHELAHLATISVGHEKDFWDNFKFLLTDAVKIGIYEKTDYASNPVPYCGIKVTSNVI